MAYLTTAIDSRSVQPTVASSGDVGRTAWTAASRRTRTTCSRRTGMGPTTTYGIQRPYKCVRSWRSWKRGTESGSLVNIYRQETTAQLTSRPHVAAALSTSSRRYAARSVVIVVSSFRFCRLHGLLSTSQTTWRRLHPVSRSFSTLYSRILNLC